MDFDKVLNLIIKEFDKEKIRYAIIGGFAMGILGIMRSTMDLDFLVNYEDLSRIEKIMIKHGYKCVFKTQNVSQYVSGLKIFGEIDFIHAFRVISLGMLKRAKKARVLEGRIEVNVLNPEDIIGLKLQAAVNNKMRKNREYADIEEIISHYQGNLNWNLIKEFFLLFNKSKEYHKLRKRYGNSK